MKKSIIGTLRGMVMRIGGMKKSIIGIGILIGMVIGIGGIARIKGAGVLTIGSVVIFGIIFLILFLLWQTGRFRRPAQPPSKPAQPSQTSWWASNWQELVTGLLLIGLISLVFMRFFPNQTKDLLKDSLTVVALVIAIAILFIGGKSEKLIKWGRGLATIVLLILLGYFIFYPAIEKQIPKEWKESTKEWTKPSPTRQVAVEVPAGKEVSTGLLYEVGDRISYSQPKGKSFWVKGVQKDIKITSPRTVLRGTVPGEVQLRGGSEPTTVTVGIIPHR